MDTVLRDCYVNALKVPRADTQEVPYSAVDARGYPLTKSAWIAMGRTTKDDETLCFFGKDVRTHAQWLEVFGLSRWGRESAVDEPMTLMTFLKLEEGRPEAWTMEPDPIPKGPTETDKLHLETLEKNMGEALDKLVQEAKKLGWDSMDTNALLATSLRTRSMHDLLFAYKDAKCGWYSETRRQKEMLLEEDERLQRNARIERARIIESRLRKIVTIRVREMNCASPPSDEEIRRAAAEKARIEAAEKAQLAAERLAKEAAERARIEAAEADRIAKEAEKLAKEAAEADRIAKEAKKLAKEAAEADRIAKEAEKLAKEATEADRIAKEAAEKLAKEAAEADRIAKEAAKEAVEVEKAANASVDKKKMTKNQRRKLNAKTASPTKTNGNAGHIMSNEHDEGNKKMRVSSDESSDEEDAKAMLGM